MCKLEGVYASEGVAGTTVNSDTHEGRDSVLTFPEQRPSVNGKLAIGVEDKLDAKAKEVEGSSSRNIDAQSSEINQPPHTSEWLTMEGGDKILLSPNQKTSINGNIDVTMEQLDSYTKDQLRESKSSQEVYFNVNHGSDLSITAHPTRIQETTNGKYTDDAISVSHEGGLKLLISSDKESTALDVLNEGHKLNQIAQPGAADMEVTRLSPTSVPAVKVSDVDDKLNFSVSIPCEEQDVRTMIVTKSVRENKSMDFSSDNDGHFHPTEVSQDIITKMEIEVYHNESLKVNKFPAVKDAAAVAQGKDTVVTIDSQPLQSSQTVQEIVHPSGIASLPSQSLTQSTGADRENIEARREYEIEVVKSIVYGGLAESITSLSVVSSAAGGGASTLNALALGTANIIGGLLIICHNLWDLKCDGVEQVSTQMVEQRDRYGELLGWRQNFVIHSAVAILSYFVFGLIPPIIYGFSFHKSDDKQLKLVVAGAASLLCILVLAVAKAYTQRPPKPYLKTVAMYVILGFLVSGVSYAAGELIERFLDELGLFRTSSVTDIVVPETRPIGSGWTSY